MQLLMDAGSQRNVYEIIPRNCAHLTFYEGDEMTDLTLVDVRLCVKIGQGGPWLRIVTRTHKIRSRVRIISRMWGKEPLEGS